MEKKKSQKKFQVKKPIRHEAILKKIYLSPENPAGYSTPYKLWKAAKKINPNITQKMVKTWLETRDSYTLYRKVKLQFPRRKIIVSGVQVQYQADLLDFAPIKKENRNKPENVRQYCQMLHGYIVVATIIILCPHFSESYFITVL